MSQAVRAILNWGINYFDLKYVMAIVDVKNYSSPKVVERSGFEKIGTKMILNS